MSPLKIALISEMVQIDVTDMSSQILIDPLKCGTTEFMIIHTHFWGTCMEEVSQFILILPANFYAKIFMQQYFKHMPYIRCMY